MYNTNISCISKQDVNTWQLQNWYKVDNKMFTMFCFYSTLLSLCLLAWLGSVIFHRQYLSWCFLSFVECLICGVDYIVIICLYLYSVDTLLFIVHQASVKYWATQLSACHVIVWIPYTSLPSLYPYLLVFGVGAYVIFSHSSLSDVISVLNMLWCLTTSCQNTKHMANIVFAMFRMYDILSLI